MKYLILIITTCLLISCHQQNELSLKNIDGLKNPTWSIQILKGSEQSLIFESTLSTKTVSMPIDGMPWACKALTKEQDGFLGSLIQCELDGHSFVLPAICLMKDFANQVIITNQDGALYLLRVTCQESL